MSNISIKVEFLAGTAIGDAIQEAKSLARRMDIAYVCFDFNGKSIHIGQNADVNLAIDDFHSKRDIIVFS